VLIFCKQNNFSNAFTREESTKEKENSTQTMMIYSLWQNEQQTQAGFKP
jgi:heme-degrading monooxygenase HmoA